MKFNEKELNDISVKDDFLKLADEGANDFFAATPGVIKAPRQIINM